jgi:uracil phosphoribosyltransferase
VLSGKKLVFAPILRAGMGLIEGMLDLVPSARVAHIGLYRDPESLVAVEYYFKAPTDLAERLVIVVDPMLATGNTAVAAVDRLKEHGASELRFVMSARNAPVGIANLQVTTRTFAYGPRPLIERLNDHGYILPGLGDAGDRLYGTR